jgi:hypothetical protein
MITFFVIWFLLAFLALVVNYFLHHNNRND